MSSSRLLLNVDVISQCLFTLWAQLLCRLRVYTRHMYFCRIHECLDHILYCRLRDRFDHQRFPTFRSTRPTLTGIRPTRTTLLVSSVKSANTSSLFGQIGQHFSSFRPTRPTANDPPRSYNKTPPGIILLYHIYFDITYTFV